MSHLVGPVKERKVRDSSKAVEFESENSTRSDPFRLFTLRDNLAPSPLDKVMICSEDRLIKVAAPEGLPVFPEEIQKRILDQFHSIVRNLGGAVSLHKTPLLRPIKQVNRQWREYTRHQFDIYPYFDFREMEDGPDYEGLEDNMRDRKTMKCICCREGVLSISLNNPQEKTFAARKKCWKKTLDRVTKQFRDIQQLNLWPADREAGECFDLVYRFPRKVPLFFDHSFRYVPFDVVLSPGLRKLYVGSTCHLLSVSITVDPEPPLQSFAPTLSRLDLDAVYIEEWFARIPSLKTLSLTHVDFGIDVDPDRTFETAREFFSSFPNLEAIGFNGVDSINSDALAFLPIFTLRHLYIGRCSFVNSQCHCRPYSTRTSDGTTSSTFIECLARHFRSQIRHLILDPHVPSSTRLVEILRSRNDKPFPPYLSKLESVRLAVFPKVDQMVCPEKRLREEGEEKGVKLLCLEETETGSSTFAGKAEETKRVKTMLDEAGLKGVEIRWWRQGEMEACTAWDPGEARYH